MTIHAYAVKSAKSELEPFEYETEPLSPIDVEVRVQYCGVCHSLELMGYGYRLTHPTKADVI